MTQGQMWRRTAEGLQVAVFVAASIGLSPRSQAADGLPEDEEACLAKPEIRTAIINHASGMDKCKPKAAESIGGTNGEAIKNAATTSILKKNASKSAEFTKCLEEQRATRAAPSPAVESRAAAQTEAAQPAA
jgi:hypothetical protein